MQSDASRADDYTSKHCPVLVIEEQSDYFWYKCTRMQLLHYRLTTVICLSVSLNRATESVCGTEERHVSSSKTHGSSEAMCAGAENDAVLQQVLAATSTPYQTPAARQCVR